MNLSVTGVNFNSKSSVKSNNINRKSAFSSPSMTDSVSFKGLFLGFSRIPRPVSKPQTLSAAEKSAGQLVGGLTHTVGDIAGRELSKDEKVRFLKNFQSFFGSLNLNEKVDKFNWAERIEMVRRGIDKQISKIKGE